jgi:hypothetical protein
MTMLKAIRHHWPEYLMESAGLGVFMISTGFFTTLLEYPASPVHQSIPSEFVRRTLPGGLWEGKWIYLSAPLPGMLVAAELSFTTL